MRPNNSAVLLAVALLGAPVLASAEPSAELHVLAHRLVHGLGSESRDVVHAACAGSVDANLGRIPPGGLPTALRSLPPRHPLAGEGAALLTQMERTVRQRDEIQGQCREPLDRWRMSQTYPGTSVAEGEEGHRLEALRCSSRAALVRNAVWEEAGACLRLLRAATRAAAGVEGPMPFGLSPFQKRSELAPVSTECDQDSCFLQIDSFTRGDYGWIGRRPDEVLVNFEAGEEERVSSVLIVIAEDDCPAALAQVRTWRERLPRLVGPSAAHFLDGEGFATACSAGKSRAWIDDFIVDLQAVVIDGTPYATVFVDYVREQGAETEARTQGGAL